jgi:hypothetical protein
MLVLGLVPPALGLPGAAGDIPPGLSPAAYLPYVSVARIPTPTPSPPAPTPAAYLPYVSVARIPTPTPTPTPAPPGPVGLKVYDVDGNQRTYQWAMNKYGVRVEQRSGQGYHCVELREVSGPSGLEVWVYQANGLPAANVRVEFWWPGDMAVRYTEASGKAGFGYGPGSWITDPAVGGPHWLVVNSSSTCDAVSRLGMLAGTPHDHLDVSYRYGNLSATP